MRAVIKFTVFCFLSMSFFSCQKELSIDNSLPGSNGNGGNNNGDATLTGNWKFISLMVNMESTTSFTQSGIPAKAIVKYSDTTENNAGTLTFTETQMKAIGFTYTISTTAVATISIPGVPVEPDYIPFDFTVPNYNATADYKKIGSDSLYFPSGALFNAPDPTGSLPPSSPPSGAKFKITGSDLAITSALLQNSTIDTLGQTASIKVVSNIIANFKKQ